MGSNVTPNNIRGFLIPYKLTKAHIWATESTFTEQNPIAGMPEPLGNYNLVVSSTGSQSDKENITIKTHRSGAVGKQTGATFTWSETGGSVDYGYDTAVQSGYEAIVSESSTINRYQSPSVCSDSAGNIFIVYSNFVLLTSVYSIHVAYRNVSDGIWTTQTIKSNLDLKPFPTIGILDDDTLIIAYWTQPKTNNANLSTLRSKDKGTTWEVMSDNALFEDIEITVSSGVTLGRMSMAITEDHIVILAAVVDNDSSILYNLIGQFVSNNQGGSFVQVGITSTTPTYDRFMPSVVAFQGNFYVSWIEIFDRVHFIKLPNPYYDISEFDLNLDKTIIIDDLGIANPTTPITDGENCLFVDTDGTFYNLSRRYTTGETVLTTSRQNGEKWKGFADSGFSGTPAWATTYTILHSMNSNSIQLTDMSACISEGRIVVVSRADGLTSIDDSIIVHYYGGYTNRTQAPMRSFPKYTDLLNWDITWTPIQTPDTSSFFTVAGTGTANLTINRLKLSTNTKRYTNTTATTPDQGYIIRMSLKKISLSNHLVLQLDLSDGSTNSYSGGLKVSPTTIEIYDLVAASTKVTASVDTSTGIEFLISIRNSNMMVYYQRFTGASNDQINSYKTWELIETTSLQNDNYTSVTSSEVTWGIILSAGQEVDFYEFCMAGGDSTGIEFNNDTALMGRSYPYQGAYSYVNGGMSITTKDGPAFTNQSYEIERSSEYEIDRALTTVSKNPRVAWRSVPYTGSSGGDMRIAFYLDPTIKENDDSEIGSDLIGVYLGNINFHKFKIQYYDRSGSAWVDMSTVNTYDGMRFNYTRSGNSVIYASEIDKFYLFHGEAIGWTILLEDSLGDFHAVEIETNTEGSYAGLVAKRAIIKLKNATTSLPTSGEARIVPTNVTVTINLLGIKSPAWAIQILDSATASTDYRIGNIMIGPVIVQAPQYSRGRAITLEPRINVLETQDSNIYTQVISDPLRILRVSWSTGVSMHDYYNGIVEPDYYIASILLGAEPVASYGDVPYQIEGLYRYLNGSDSPLVYLPKIIKDTGSNRIQVHNRRESHIYGVTVGDMSYENMLGDEMDNEVLRVNTLTIREIV